MVDKKARSRVDGSQDSLLQSLITTEEGAGTTPTSKQRDLEETIQKKLSKRDKAVLREHRERSRNGNQRLDCRSTNDSGQLNTGAGLARLDAPESELFTILDLGCINGEPAGRVLCAIHIDVETDSTAAIGMDSGMSWNALNEILQSRAVIRVQMTLEVNVRGKSDTDLRVIVTWDVKV